jgi:heat shock protein HslJ
MATSHMLERRPLRTAAAISVAALSLACATLAQSSASELVNRDWRLRSIRGTAVLPTAGMREPYMRISGDSLRMSGWGSCNRISGTATVDADHLSFGPVIATRMACADAQLNRQESEFLTALNETSRYRIRGDTLVLSRDGEELARLISGSP